MSPLTRGPSPSPTYAARQQQPGLAGPVASGKAIIQVHRYSPGLARSVQDNFIIS